MFLFAEPSQALVICSILALTILSLLFYLRFPLRKRSTVVAVIHSIGTANPERTLSKSEFLEIVDTLGYPDDLRSKMGRTVEASGIERRFCASPSPPKEYLKAMEAPGYRSGIWQGSAHTMAISAAKEALAHWRHGTAKDITHVVVHSCTGFSAPGLDFLLIQALGLPSTTRKLGVNFMGWFV